MWLASARKFAASSVFGFACLALGCAGTQTAREPITLEALERQTRRSVARKASRPVAEPIVDEIVPAAWTAEFDEDRSKDSQTDKSRSAEDTDTLPSLDASKEPAASLLPLPIDLTDHSETLQSGDDADSLTLEQLISMALSNNPAVAEARAAASEAAGIRTQVGLRPNPTIAYVAEEIGADGAGGLHNLNLSQTFVRGGKLELNRAVIDRDVQRLLWQADTQATRVRTDVAIRFYSALASQRRVELADAFLLVAEKGVELAEQRLEAGEGTRADVLQAEVLRNEVRLLEQRAHLSEEGARRRLAALTGSDRLSVRLTGSLEQSSDGSTFESRLATLTARSPVILAAKAEVQRARLLIERHSVQPIPNVTGQIGIGQDLASDNTFANIGVSLPVPVHNRNQGNVARARADYCRALQKVERLRRNLADQLAVAMQNYAQAQATASLYTEQIVPKAEEARELVEEAYLAGEFDFLRVLTARRAAFDANLAYVSSLAEVASQRARLDGLLLSGGYANGFDFEGDDGLRDLSLSGQ